VKNDEFEKLVEVALKVSPEGISGRHKNEPSAKVREPMKG